MKRCRDYSELDLFTECDQNPLFEKITWDEFGCDETLSNQITELTFNIRPGGKRTLIDLSRAQIYIKSQIVHKNGNPLADIGSGPTKKVANNQVAMINNSLHSMFEDCFVYLNDKHISNSNKLHPYKSYYLDLLDTSIEQKENYMTAQGWYPDAANSFGQTNATLNPGWGKRAEFFGANEQGLIGTLHSEIFNQHRYLLNGVKTQVTLKLADPNFLFISGMKDADNKDVEYKLKIKDARMYVPYVHLSEKAMDEIESELKKKDAVYPLKRIITKSIPVSADSSQHTFENISGGQLPTKLVVGFVDSKAKEGEISSNPLYFDDYKLKRIELKMNGMPYSKSAFTTKFNELNYAKTYMNIFESLNYIEDGTNTPPITKEDFAGGYAIYPFNLNPACPSDPGVFKEEGSLSLEIQFEEGTRKELQMIIMFVYDSCLRIDKHRNVTCDWLNI